MKKHNCQKNMHARNVIDKVLLMALILIVDDDLDNLILLEEFLHGINHSCRFATSGKMALCNLSEEKFDLIISDLNMAHGDGLWLLQQLTNVADAPKCIVVTNDVRFDSEYFLKEGAAAHLQKPLNWVILKKEINKLV